MGRKIVYAVWVSACVAVAACGGTVIEKRTQGDSPAGNGSAGFGAGASFAGSAGGTNLVGGLLGGTISSGGFGPIDETGGFAGTAGGMAIGGFGPGGAPGVGGISTSTGGFPSIPDGGVCTGISFSAEYLELELLFVVDQSLPLGCTLPDGNGTPWLGMTGGIEDFAKAPSRPFLAMGLELFGRPMDDAGPGSSSSCYVNDYRAFDVDPASVPMNAGNLNASLDAHHPSTDGTLSAAYAGAMLTLEAGLPDPGKMYAVVLVTGTEPDICSVSASSPAATAADGLNSKIKTFVISTAAPSSTCVPNSPPRSIDLNEIAAQGGSGKAFVLDPSAPLDTQMVAAIDAIVDQLDPPVCTYPLGSQPLLSGQGVEVEYTDSSGPHVVNEVSKGTCDPNTGGWYIDDPTNPTKIDLCAASCEAASAGAVTIQLGCIGAFGSLPN
jgi:hypothetical protein